MNSQQAKEILLLYRPGLNDDPEMAAALAVAKTDAELERWLGEHMASQEALRAKFRQIPVPEGLKEQILSERQAHTTLSFRRGVLVTASILAVIALSAVLLSILRPHPEKSFANFRSRMVGIVARAYPKMDLETNDLNQIRAYLTTRQAPSDYSLPTRLQQTTSTGCAVLQWRGKTVSMVCFNSGTGPKAPAPDLFLFVVNRSDVPNAPDSATPQFSQSNRVALASWSDQNKTYILAAFGEESALKQYF